jgi:protocatechuate 3,4-dioxygenase beta subunit
MEARMTLIGTNRRLLMLGGVALGMTGSACAQPQGEAKVRPDLYNGELDYLAKQFTGRAEDLPATLQLSPASEPGERVAISGRCLSWQTGQPVPGVIIYAYHTDSAGSYDGGPAGTRHARLRGWMRTGKDGGYAFTSIKPAPYPARSMPAHIHLTVLEPGRAPYWIDDIVFDGEFRVDAAYRRNAGNRGGDGIIPLQRQSGVWTGVRDIRLERHPT